MDTQNPHSRATPERFNPFELYWSLPFMTAEAMLSFWTRLVPQSAWFFPYAPPFEHHAEAEGQLQVPEPFQEDYDSELFA